MVFKYLYSIMLTVMISIAVVNDTIAQESIQDNTVRIKVGTSYGSGAYVGDRLVLSCAHLYKGEGTTYTDVWFKDGEQHTGKLVKVDYNWDQSLIELDTKPAKNGIPIAPDNPKPGQIVHAYGYGRQNTIMATTGYVNKYLHNDYDTSAADWFALSGAVEEGSSGGPITDANGYIVGNLWGTDGVRTVGLCTGRTRIFLSPWQARLARGRCVQGICYPIQPQQPPRMVPLPQQPPPNLTPLPQEPLPLPVPDTPAPIINTPQPINNCLPCGPQCRCMPVCPGPQCKFDAQQVADILKQDPAFLDSIRGAPGQDGIPGQDGLPGQDAELTAEHMAAMTAAIIQQLQSDQTFLDSVTGPPGQDGVPGQNGMPGQDGAPGANGQDAVLTDDHIAAMTAAIIEQLKSDQEFLDSVKGDPGVPGETPNPPPLPGSSADWSHLVLVAPIESDYWYRLEYDYNKATTYYDDLRHVEPPTDRNIGPMPLLVAYNQGKPVKSWTGLRDVSQALNYITRGEYDEFLFATSDEN